MSLAIKEAPALLKKIWQELDRIPAETLINEGRVYGGGLHKLEPNELANANIEFLKSILPSSYQRQGRQTVLF